MIYPLLIFIFIRPFISSLAYPRVDIVCSCLIISLSASWIILNKKAWARQIRDLAPAHMFSLLFLSWIMMFGNRAGLAEQFFNYAPGLLAAQTACTFNRDQQKKLLAAIAWGALLISLSAIYQYFFGLRHVLSYIRAHGINDQFALDYLKQHRVFFPMVTPNIMAGYLAYTLPICLLFKPKLIFLFFIMAAVLFAKSLGAGLSLTAGVIAYGYLSKKPKCRLACPLAICLAVLTAVIILRLAFSSPHTHPLFSAGMRMNYWGETLKIILSHPLKGVGPGNLALTGGRYSHNLYLQLWAETGIIVLSSFLWLAFAGLKNGITSWQSANSDKLKLYLSVSAFIFLVHNLLDFSFFIPEASLSWWIIIGILLKRDREIAG